MRFSEHYQRFRRELPDRERITLDMYERTVTQAVDKETQEGGRTAFWGYVYVEDKYLKVVIEPDMEEIVTAHFDRGFKRKMERRQK